MQYRNNSTYAQGEFASYWFIKNVHGDIVSVCSNTGDVLISYTYDAWGNVTTTYSNGGADTAAVYNPFKYRGYYHDSETGFYYLNSRYYDPVTCRFINSDGLINQGSLLGYNLFAYCHNNPANMTDTTGQLPFFVITAAIGAIAGAIVGGVIAAQNGGNVWAGIGVGAAVGALAGAGLGALTSAALTCSITATTTKVIIGAKTFVDVVNTAGIVAGGQMIADNISRMVNNVGTVLYSGGEQAKNAATTYANNSGGTIIDNTVMGQVADYVSKLQGSDARAVWSHYSSVFCGQARGVVHAFVSSGSYNGEESILWSIEIPALLNNPNVTEIIIHFFE